MEAKYYTSLQGLVVSVSSETKRFIRYNLIRAGYYVQTKTRANKVPLPAHLLKTD